MSRLLFFAAAAVAAAIFGFPTHAQGVKIESGMISGASDGNGVVSFKGIPYAAAPVKSLRWRAPQPVKPWSGIRDATRFSSICPQASFAGSGSIADAPQSEDCLYLNIWAPSAALGPGRKSPSLPVLVSIHGGGLVNGSGSVDIFDGAALARRGIIVVTFNYRLGRLGFFNHPALAKENADGGLRGNYGFLDQVAVLKWVQRNIASVGGDPNRVTIAGESAGGVSVQMLMISPLARGLFSAAIAQSSAPRLEVPSAAAAEQIGRAFAEASGVPEDDLNALRAISVSKLLKGAEFFNPDRRTFSGAFIDGQTLPEPIMTAFASGRQARLPLIIGANGRELGSLPGPAVDAIFGQLPAPVQAIVRATYNPGGKRSTSDFAVDFLSDQAFVEPARTSAIDHAALGIPVWTYRFDYVAEHLRPTTPGAVHASEVAYTFGTIGTTDPKASAEDRKAADMMADYWANFVRTHDPNGPGPPQWPRVGTTGDPVLMIGNNATVAGPDPRAARLDALARFATSK